MGNVLRISEPALDLVLYGNKTAILNGYLMQQMQQIRPGFNEFSDRIYQSLQNTYNFVNDKLVQYGLLNQLHSQGIQVVDNYYVELTSFTALQNANPTMQRWVMCHPEVKQLYVDQNLDGYSNTYKNVFGKGVGDDDYNYCLATDGLVQDTENGFVVKHHIQDLLPGDRELDHYEKVMISHSHDTIKYILDTCKFDFTVTSEEPIKINRS